MTHTPRRPRRIALFLSFALYVLAIVLLLVVPNNYRGHNVFVGGLTVEQWAAHVARNFNLVPLRGIAEQISSILHGQHLARNVIYLVGNIVGFIPLGFFLPALFARQRRFLPFLITVLASITILELTQALTMNGTFDIDDIILNTAGACLGFIIARKRAGRSAAQPESGN